MKKILLKVLKSGYKYGIIGLKSGIWGGVDYAFSQNNSGY